MLYSLKALFHCSCSLKSPRQVLVPTEWNFNSLTERWVQIKPNAKTPNISFSDYLGFKTLR